MSQYIKLAHLELIPGIKVNCNNKSFSFHIILCLNLSLTKICVVFHGSVKSTIKISLIDTLIVGLQLFAR